MLKGSIVSPMATGNGAYVLHKSLESHITGYSVAPYNPWLTLFPPALKMVGCKLKAELIHTTPDYAIWLSRRNVPLVVTFHNYVLDAFMRPYSSALQRMHYRSDLSWFTRQAASSATAITAVSHFTADLVRRDLGVDKQIRVIYNGIDEVCFSPSPRSRLSGPIKVLFSGNLTQRKGVQWILPIADRLDEGIRILYTQGLRSAATQLPEHPRLHCLGHVPYADMPELYGQVDILLLPTVREGLPMAVLEAMASGLPVVATDCSSLPELIDQNKGGFLCPLGDVDAFSERINQLANSTLLRNTMGQYNRARVEAGFTLRHMVAEYEALFRELLEKQAP